MTNHVDGKLPEGVIALENGYTVRYNSLFRKWILAHENIGACVDEFSTFEEAENHAHRG